MKNVDINISSNFSRPLAKFLDTTAPIVITTNPFIKIFKLKYGELALKYLRKNIELAFISSKLNK
jgi:hypothetical protein